MHFCRRPLALILTILFALPKAQACVAYSHSNQFPTGDSQVPVFHSIVDDKAVVMGFSVEEIPVDGGSRMEQRQVFNFFYCDRFQDFQRGQSERYEAPTCFPMSPLWIPVVDPSDKDRELITQFSNNVVYSLKNSLEVQLGKIDADPYWVAIDGVLSRTLAGLFATSTLVVSFKMRPPASRFSKMTRNALRGAAALTLFAIGISAWAESKNEQEYENIYHQNLKELNSLIASIDGDPDYFNQASQNEPVIYIFEELKKAVEQSMESIVYGECGYI